MTPVIFDHFEIDSLDLNSDKHIVDNDQTGMYSDRVQFNNFIVEAKKEKIVLPKQVENQYQLSYDNTTEDN